MPILDKAEIVESIKEFRLTAETIPKTTPKANEIIIDGIVIDRVAVIRLGSNVEISLP